MNIKFSKKLLVWAGVIIGIIVVCQIYLLTYDYSSYSDRMTLLYAIEGKSQATMIELRSYETLPHLYHQTYSVVDITEGMKPFWDSVSVNSLSKEFEAQEFVYEIQKANNENILDEDYFINLRANGKDIKVDLRDLRGDFLVNNSLERFTYVNMGETKVSVNGKTYPAAFSLNRKASVNYKKVLEDQSVGAAGNAIFLSDNLGQVYYADVTQVSEQKTKYLSHAWALNKNHGLLKKEVGERVLLNEMDPYTYHLTISPFDGADFNLKKVSTIFLGQINYSLLEGYISDIEGERKVIGFSLDYDTR